MLTENELIAGGLYRYCYREYSDIVPGKILVFIKLEYNKFFLDNDHIFLYAKEQKIIKLSSDVLNKISEFK